MKNTITSNICENICFKTSEIIRVSLGKLIDLINPLFNIVLVDSVVTLRKKLKIIIPISK